MSIRVENDQISSASSLATRVDQVSKPPNGASRSSSVGTPGQDQIDVSSATANISAALSTHGASRAGKVQQLSALYASGQYKVDAAQVSQALVSGAIGGSGAGAGNTGAGKA